MVTNNEVSADEATLLSEQGFKPGELEWDNHGIARNVTWPRTVSSIKGRDISGTPLEGDYGVLIEDFVLNEEDTVVSKSTGKPISKKIYIKKKIQKLPKMAEIKKSSGFEANAAFFKLGFLDRTSVALGRQFKEMLPTLWMKAGAHGPCPNSNDEGVPVMMVLPENKFAILTEEAAFPEFEVAVNARTQIETVYIVTDYEAGYYAMAKNLRASNTYQLYRDYLDNFRINTGRN
jgi:adenine-specific DNA-methyltransferase